jgi:hypothetical protein
MLGRSKGRPRARSKKTFAKVSNPSSSSTIGVSAGWFSWIDQGCRLMKLAHLSVAGFRGLPDRAFDLTESRAAACT